MSVLISVLVAMALGLYLNHRNTEKAREAAAKAAADVPLATRLHKLNETLEPFGRDSAHTNELLANDDFKTAVTLLSDLDVPVETVFDYATGQAWVISCAAYVALKNRVDGSEVVAKVPERFDNLSVWQMRFALDYLAAASPRPPAGAPLVGYRDWWPENALLRHVFADYFTALGDDDAAEPGADVLALPATTRQNIKAVLANIRHPIAARLSAKLGDDMAANDTPPVSAFLASIGRFWESDKDAALLIEAEPWTDVLKAAERLVNGGTARVLLVSGDPLVGKTSFLRLLAERVKTNGWRVFQASGADLQAGQMYIGQLEGRIRDALAELDVGKKLIWYIPDLLALALSGTHQSQSASILDQIMPALSAGRVQIWAEASPAATARLQQMRPALRRLLEIVRMEDMDEDDTLVIARALGERLGKASACTVLPGAAETAVDVAQNYLGSMHLPGSALSILKMTVLRAETSSSKQLGGHDVLETLAQLTGLPLSILDGNEKLNLDEVRNFFSGRVIGQPEAVASIVERIAMLKSGLNDPGKPIAVFLFAGPTGTGKTELAKTTAEYLFGSADRMIRLDMSEYQAADSGFKIIGAGSASDAETLVSRIRKQPFSVVLLDEFEKAHPQVWDLFLQVFDEGRLSDSLGQLADFRHSIIILTTNLGATAHRDSGIGFTPSSSSFTNEQIHRAIAQTFRPEFQNRLDRVIVFRPLTRELMRGILNKELQRVFERRGLRNRDWAVEWDASAVEFLLEKGFSPEMGARPLKRAVDHYVIAPLAETIVERRFPEGDQFVFIRRDSEALKADFVDPDGDEDVHVTPAASSPHPSGAAPSLFDMMRAPSGDAHEIAALAGAEQPIIERLESDEWAALKSSLAKDIGAADFWSRPNRNETLLRLELMDRIEVAAETARSLQNRMSRQARAPGKSMRDLVARLAMQVHLVKEGLRDLDDKSAVEAAVIVEPVFATGLDERETTLKWCREIAQMYRDWAGKRNMTLSAIDGVAGLDRPVLIVGGFGASRTLAREGGLHVLEQSDSDGATARLTAQVLIVTPPLGNASKSEIRKALSTALAGTKRGTNIVRRYRLSPPLVRNGDGSIRSGKVEDVLAGNFDLFGEATA